MSGIDAAGLLLGIFPLLLTAAEKYERGYEILTDWIQFRREFANFYSQLQCQRILLRQLTETTLSSVTELGVDVQTMLDNPDCEQWKDVVITEKLKQKLSREGEYEVFCSGLWAVHEQLNELAKQLKVDNLQALAEPGAENARLRKEFKKLQFCFRKERLNEKVGNITRHINLLKSLLDNAGTLEPSRRSWSSNVIPQMFERVRRQAASLHRAITKAWTCDCRQNHSFKLLLSKSDRKGLGPTQTRCVPAEKEKRLKLALPFGMDTNMQHDTTIVLRGEYVGPWCTAEASMASEPGSDQIQLKSNRFSTFRIHDGNQNQRGSVSPGYPGKTTLSYDAAQSSHLTSITDLGDSPVIKDLCYILRHRAETESHLGYLYDGSSFYHALKVVSRTYTSEMMSRVVSLGQILTKDDRVPVSVNLSLSRAKRLSISLTIAYSFLELFPSPWLPDSWDKNDIYFFVDNAGRVVREHPFLVHENGGTRHGAVNPDHSRALLSLGTLILELWFDQPLESQPSWRTNFAPDGNEARRKFYAAAVWQEKIRDDGGRVLDDITRRCIYGNFGLATESLEDKELVKAIYEGVIRELEKIVDGFE